MNFPLPLDVIKIGVTELCRRNKVCREQCHVYLKIERWDEIQTRSLLSTLSELLLNSECTEAVAESFPSLLLQILSNSFDDSEQTFEKDLHKVRCVALGKLVTIHQDAVRFSLEYFRKNPPPFHVEKCAISPGGIPSKKKKTTYKEVSDYDLVLATYNFLSTSCEHWRQHWNWSSFLEYLKHRDEAVRWLACQCIATVSGMAYCQRQLLTSKYVANESALNFNIEFEQSNKRIKSKKFGFLQESTSASMAKNENLSVTSPFVVSVAGILLPVFDSSQVMEGNLVLVPSTITNLRSLALAVASGKAVCLEGPVGCGKTALVEYLALITGRRKSPNFIKIQLGDQTDSKMLLGTYRCTDVPGEFVWHPGVLTQAVIAGHWILLEDIDSAPTDVIAVLASLMETGSISVPGYRDSVHAAPGFQLFTTQRLIPGNVGGFHKQQIGSTGLMEKLWIKVSMEPLSGSELIHVVKTLYPVLNTISPRLLKVYLLFSAGKHHTALPSEELIDEVPMEVDKEINMKAHTIGSRLTSTRDLLKWCARIVVGYDVSSQETSLNVLANAMDMFCCSMSDPAQRLELAGDVAVCLGIIRLKAEYLCQLCKPVVNSTQELLCVGRAKMKRLVNPNLPASMKSGTPKKNNFCLTRPTCQLVERVGVCVTRSESVLLVGETGTGKTSVVQFLATELNTRLIVLNMNQQSDTADLLGGYKPVDLKCIITPVKENYESLFVKTFSRKQNVKFLEHISTCYHNKNWKTLLKLMKHTTSAGIKRVTSDSNDKNEAASKNEWTELWKQLERLEIQLKNSTLAFSFIEGSLVKALRAGLWVLLDEINLATGETLECLSGLLEGVGDINGGSLCLHERGDTTPIVRHPNFRLFACMNPATDVGKKDLPPGLRNRFTEFFVDEITDKNDLIQLCGSYLSAFVVPPSVLENIVSFYLKVRKEASISLSDGTGHKPHYSLRTLCRALTIAASNPCGAYLRSLYEAFCLGFLTQLDRASYPIVEGMISKALFKSEKENKSSLVKKQIPEPNPHGSHVYIEGYWVRKGSLEPKAPERYILTPSVRQNLRDIARVVSLSGGSQPALIQGETSVGKTSLIEYLAAATGNVTLRVNNHEHTDLQEYVGAYTADAETGKMVFHEGVLVEAMRKGYWIILDELNLAPSDVLEALNRVLDDNRELYIPETQEMVQAHPHFMLFATQNPPGHYGGRKLLSRAFRNRFVELHFDEIPPEELRTILEMRCDMPPSYSKKLVSVMTDLQIYRRGSAMFAGKQGFITLRDLFRWGERYRLANHPQGEKTFYDWDCHLAHEGYLLLAGRVRKEEERKVIAEAIKKHLKRGVDPEELFTLNSKTSPVTRYILEELVLTAPPDGFQHLVWTKNMRRQAVLLAKAFQFDEPVLLVGETGIGKTTSCQLLAALRNQKLHTVNCHMHTEGADFLGGLRPVREHSNDGGSDTAKKLFEWVDGPLIKAMSGGDVFLADEISLADDSVLERLNSLLEPERKLLLAEKGGGSDGANAVVLVAHPKFHFVGTMNPGGDFGKKELSPALRNRFTEIWCEGCRDRGDLMCLIEENLRDGLSLANQEDATSGIGHIILEFVAWFSSTEIGKRFTISIRDYLNWINFINVTTKDSDANSHDDGRGESTIKSKLDLPSAIVHGACFTFLDSLGSGISSSEKTSTLRDLQESAVKYLVKLVENSSGVQLNIESFLAKNATTFEIHPNRFGTVPFFIGVGDKLMYHDISIMQRFSFDAPTTGNNARRLLRALQIGGRPILLEGSPGVGKTALVAALANGANHRLVRINLSEQTDVSDLFGADLPVEGGEGGQFAWRDGPFLQALKSGSWIVLDELNLASQSVLEGLNAALDHRGEVYVPELDRSFFIQKNTTRIFACQNPLNQGGARRGLPRSFLNRFTQVYIDALTSEDLELILASAFPAAPQDLISQAVCFNSHLARETQELRLWGHRGAPWEFNLRDLLRWFEAMNSHHDYSKKYGSGPKWDPAKYVQLLYVDRMRTLEDKEKVKQHYMDVFGKSLYKEPSWDPPRIRVGGDTVWFGDITLMRTYAEPLTYPLAHNAHPKPNQLLLHRDVHALRSIAICIQMKWLPILVGGVGSGKTSLVQLLAHLTGNELRIMPVNSSMDTTEILGGFEQTDYTRHFDLIAEKTERLVMHSLRKHLLSPGEMHENPNNSSVDENLSMARNLLRRWEEFQRLSSDFHIYNEKNGEVRLFQQKMESLLEVLKTLEQILVSNVSTKAKSMIGKVEKLWKDLKTDELHLEDTLKADIKMQFESLAAQASELVEYGQKILKKSGKNDNNYKKLKQLWEEFEYYLSFTHEIDEASDAFPVGSLFKKRLSMLKEVLKILKLNNVIYERTEAESMIWQLENLESIVEGDGGKLNGGGKFEWIDSILVKCLKEGCWLVVENVNLCSSAVLDRLNALLEPNGTLTIGERGVGPYDDPPTIIPHPDFRLFFTLDPRHGQISRAMRNRGVEIFILGPEESVEYDLMDTRALLSESGVENVDLQAKLLAIHNLLSARFIGPDKPSLQKLLCVTFLLYQQLSHSALTCNSFRDSIKSAFCDVYIRPQKGSIEAKRAALVVLNEALQVISNSEVVDCDVADSINSTVEKYIGWACKEVSDWHITPRCSDLEVDTFGTFSRQRGVILEMSLVRLGPGETPDDFPGVIYKHSPENVLPDIKLPYTEIWRSGMSDGCLNEDRLNAWKFLSRSILAYYATSSADESVYRHQYLTSLSKSVRKSVRVIVDKMSETISNVINQYPCRPDKPWDPRWWNTCEPVDQKVNAWDLLMELKMMQVLECARSEDNLWWIKPRTEKTFLTLKDIHRHLKDGSLPEALNQQHSTQPISSQYMNLCQLLDTVFDSVLRKCSECVDNWEIFWHALQWRARFVGLGLLPICKPNKVVIPPQVEELLWIHVKWVLKHVARPLASVVPCASREASSSLEELQKVLLQLEKSHSKASDSVVHLAKVVGTKFGWPNPYGKEEEAITAKEIERLEKVICHNSYTPDLKSSNLCFLLTAEGIKCHQDLIEAHLKLWDGDVCTASTIIKNVLESCKSVKLKVFGSQSQEVIKELVENESSLPSTTMNDAIDAQLWPLNEIIVITLSARLKKLLFTKMADFYCDENYLHSLSHKKMDVDKDSARIEAISAMNERNLIDADKILPLTSSLYFAAMHSTSASPRLVASVRRLYDLIKAVHEGVPLNMCEWLVSVHEFVVSSAVQDEISPARCDIIKWTNIQGLPPEDESDILSQYQQNQGKIEPIQMHAPVLSLAVTSFIISDENNKNSLLRSAPINLYNKRKTQLKIVSETLWKNQNSLCSEDFDYKINDAKSAIALSSALLVILKTNSFTNDASNTWEGMLSLYIKLLEEKKQMLEDTLQQWISGNKNEVMLISLTGMCWSLYGGLCVLLRTASGLVDPAHKRSIKIHYFKDELENIQLSSYVHDMHSRIELGLKLDELSEAAIHPTLNCMKTRASNLQKKVQSLSERIAARPTPSAYYELSTALHNFVMRISSPKTLSELHDKLSEDIKTLTSVQHSSTEKCISNAKKSLQECNSLRKSLLQFAHQLTSQFGPWYKEMVTPVIGSIHQIVYGLSLQASALEKVVFLTMNNLSHMSLTSPPSLDNFISKLICFPTVGPNQQSLCSLAKVCVSSSTTNLVEKAYNTQEIPSDEKERYIKWQTLRLMMVGLEEIKNELAIRKEIRREHKSWDALMAVLHNLAKAWKKDQELRRVRKAEEESLYSTRCAKRPGEDDDQIDPAAVALQFPTFKEDFQDIEGLTSLDDTSSHGDSALKKYSLETLDFITEECMAQIANLHSKLVTSLTVSSWISPDSDSAVELKESINYVEPLLERFGVFHPLLRNFYKVISADIDVILYPSLNILSAVALQESSSLGDSTENRKVPFLRKKISSSSSKEHPDFYHDSWQAETVRCYPLLKGLKTDVQKLLSTWPEHPVLNQICVVIDRIMAFSPTSPLARFVTGLELTLAKAQEWEANAHSGVSLSNHLALLTTQILEWRKLELSCWKDCLDRSVERAKARASKWWFHLFWLVHSYINPEEDINLDDEKEALKATEPRELLNLLKQFMEDSPVVEFETRLDLLYSFHCHTIHMEVSDRQSDLQKMIWNVHSFYSQFSTQVKTYIERLRKPIEKKLKDFVKIARWNDISYWSVKETVTKIHRTLHKHVREFEKILQYPVSSVLTQPKEKETVEEGIWDKDNQVYVAYLGEQDEINVSLVDTSSYLSLQKLTQKIEAPKADSGSLMGASGSYFNRARHLCKEIVTSFEYPLLNHAVEKMTVEVIETATELGSLQVPVGLPKAKQRSAAKNILQRKRRALADLFQMLNKMGISYRKGLMITENYNSKESWTGSLDMFLLPPLNMNAAFKQLKYRKSDSYLLKMWDGCEKYYVRSIARLTQMNTVLSISPSKDLGPPSIERFRGSTAHLMHMAKQQKELLIQSSNHLVMLRQQLSYLSSLGKSDENCLMPRQDLLKNLHSRLTDLLCSSIVCLSQIWLYLHACPSNPPSESECLRIVKLPEVSSGETPEINLSNSVMGDENWLSVTNDIRLFVASLTQLKSDVERMKITGDFPVTPIHWAVFLKASDNLEIYVDRIKKMRTMLFGQFLCGSTLPCAAESLDWLVNEMTSLSSTIKCENERISQSVESATVVPEEKCSSTIQHTQVENHAESLLKRVLLIFQSFYKKYCGVKIAGKEDERREDADKKTEEVGDKEKSAEEKENEADEIQDKHLSDKINASIANDVEILQLGCITTELKELIQDLSILMDEDGQNPGSLNCKRMVLSCLPALDQLSLLAQFVVTQLTVSYRTTSKLLSVLLALFSDLASRGFCIPRGLDDDQEGKDDGPGGRDGKWEESEGVGLGDAEDGDEKAKEASDKLESEDQLEGAHQQGKEKEEKADKDLKEEETGVEMSEDFEGKLQDLGEKEEEGDGESESGDDDDDADKQMGKTGSEAEKLDDQIWGSDESEDEEGDEEMGSDGEDDQSKGKGEQPELRAKDQNLGKAEGEEEEGEGKEDKKKNKPDINEMEDKGEIDDDQVDPYHGNQEPLPEPEALDLPDDLQLDDGEAKDKEGDDEENPFDIDKMKDLMGDGNEDQEDKASEKEEEKGGGEEPEGDDGEDEGEEEGTNVDGLKQDKSEEMEVDEEGKEEEGEDNRGDGRSEEKELETKEEEKGDEEEKVEEKQEEAEPSDDRPSIVPVESASDAPKEGSKDKTESSQDELNMEEGKNEEDSAEKHGVGLAQEEQKKQGHGGETEDASLKREKSMKEEVEKEEKKRRRKPGELDSKRTLGEVKEPLKKKLKTVETESKKEVSEEETKESAEEEKEQKSNEESEMYEHIKEAKQKSEVQTLDAATEDQAKLQPTPNLEEEEADKNIDEEEDLAMQEDKPVVVDEENPPEQKPEEVEGNENEKRNKAKREDDQKGEGRAEGKAEVEGEVVPTVNVQRGAESSFHTLPSALDHKLEVSVENPEELRKKLEQQLAEWSQPPAGDEALSTWENFVVLTESLSRDLSEQLRLVLEPTHASRLRGDYRTGRRINMRKVIPYIASQFRKDKIWLRRTKPSKREYQIVLAIDDSSSMADNHSKELAFESLALVSRALTLLEAGQLAVVSFGESVKVLHPLHEPFSEHSGARLLQQFSFDQKKTLMGSLMETVTSMLCGSKSSCSPGVGVAQLLVIVSDGRGVWNEGSDKVKNAVRRAQDAGIFTVFVIIDNPESKDSIMDIRMPIFKDGKMLGISSYLDNFPFPFYLILRNINALPGVLSDALRQWFELVTEMDKQ